MVKKIAVYGSFKAEAPVKQRYRVNRRDGVFQRYWKTTRRKKTVEKDGRYEFYGKGKDLYRVVRLAHRIMPKGFVTVSAEKFLRNPENYGMEGSWIEREIES